MACGHAPAATAGATTAYKHMQRDGVETDAANARAHAAGAGAVAGATTLYEHK